MSTNPQIQAPAEVRYERWKDFATRMARTCWSEETTPTSKWVLSTVKLVFDQFLPDDPNYYHSWDDNADGYEECSLVCDILSEWGNSSVYYAIRQYATDLEWEWYLIHHDLFDGIDDENMIADEIEEKWTGPVKCCIRAGMDLAFAPSAGVVGFSIGDIRRMYPEGIPEWITEGGDWSGFDDNDPIWL